MVERTSNHLSIPWWHWPLYPLYLLVLGFVALYCWITDEWLRR